MNRVLDESATLSTSDALRRLAKGPDDCAWTTVLHRHGPDILRATRRILIDPMSAEDACQETLLQIRDRAGQFRGRPGAPDATARNWIMRIACNTALHMLRQRKRAKAREHNAAGLIPLSVEALDPGNNQHEELAAKVRAEVAELPENQRLPLVLHFYAGLDYEQISSELRCGMGAARVRVHRAVEKLRKRLATLGVVLTAAALYTLLSSSTASAAEAVLDPERLARWRELLFSSQQAAINVVHDPHVQAIGKLGYAAAAALAGTLAMSFGSGGNAGTAGTPISRLANPATPSPAQRAPVKPEVPVAPIAQVVSAAPAVSKTAKLAESENPPIGRLAFRPTTPPAEIRDARLVSPLAQLEMLQTLQHELNLRVSRIHEEIESRRLISHGVLSANEQTRLRRAADDQAELSNLIQKISDEIRCAQPAEDQHTAMH